MKSKLTISVDEEIIPKAKRFASQQKLSLSALIEELLAQAMGKREESFAAKWLGRFKPARRNDVRYKALAEKYLKD